MNTKYHIFSFILFAIYQFACSCMSHICVLEGSFLLWNSSEDWRAYVNGCWCIWIHELLDQSFHIYFTLVRNKDYNPWLWNKWV